MAPIPTLEELRIAAESLGVPVEDRIAFVLKQQETYREREIELREMKEL